MSRDKTITQLTELASADLAGADLFPVYDASASGVRTKKLTIQSLNQRNGIFNPRDYGATGDGTTDDSGAFQDCEDARALVNGRMVIPTPATGYRFDSTVTCTAARGICWESAPGAEIICHVADGPAVKFAHATATRHLKIDGLRIKAGVAGHRRPLVQFGASGSSVSRFSVKNLVLDLNDLNRDGVHQYEMFDGTFHCTLESGQAGGPMIVNKAPTLNSGNVHYDSCQSTTSPILFLLNEYLQGNSNNSIHINNCKLARRSDLTTNRFYAGTVAAGGASAGATTINLTAGQGASAAAAAGDWIVVASGTSNMWVDKIASVSTDELTLTASAGLPFALSAGDPVIFGYWHTVAGPNIKGVTMTDPQFERCNGVLGVNATVVDIMQPAISADHFRTAYLAKGCQSWTVRKPLAFVAYGSGAVIMHQANEANNGRNAVVGPIKVTGTVPTVIQKDGGNQLSFTNRGGGSEMLLGVWTQTTTVAANQSAVQLTGPTGVATYGVRMRSTGCLVALNIQSRVARSAGTLTAIVYKNGSATALTAVLDGTNTFNKLTEHFDESEFVTFVPGDILDVRVTTDASWAPTSNDIAASLYVSQ